MGREIVGLKIGASRLSAARLSMNGSAELRQLAEEPLPYGVFAGGEVKDADALGAALKDFFKKHKLPKRNVRVGVANNRIGVRTIELSGISDPKQISNAVRFRAQEALPIPVEQAVLDYQVLSEGTDEKGVPVKKVLLVVAYRELIDSYVSACRTAGVRLVGIDLEAFALLRALVATNGAPAAAEAERAALVAVAIGSDRSTLAVSDGLTCEFTRVLDWGGRSLTTAVARALEVDADEAERIKRAISLQGPEAPEGLSPEQLAKAQEALQVGMQTFGRELVSSLQFYQSQEGSLGIREVVLAGGGAQLGGFAAAVQQLIGVTVRVADPLQGVSVGKKVKGEGGPAVAVPIGLGMGA
ncbi:MAG TPA: type IV pilus assembly protein PilM [Gaiellaceae bacterium]|jgi:type IV pilus assembly protein PilM